MKKNITLTAILLLGFLTVFAQKKSYKEMMYDHSVNFYDVVKEAEQYFENREKGKGSGWKGFERWRNENESKFYPSGDRSHTDPYLVSKAYERLQGLTPKTKASASTQWKDLGPYDANNVTSHYSPGIGRVESFWINPNNTQHMYLGSRSGGFWKTDNDGNSWKNTTDYLVATGVNTIAVSPTNPDSILINVQNAGNYLTHGVYRSTDGGDNWTLSNFSPANLGWGGLGSSVRVYKIVYHPRISDLIFIGTSRGIYRSDDNLQTWTSLYSSGDITDIEFHPTQDSIVYIYDNDFNASGGGNVIRVSTDLGLNYSNSGSLSGNSGSQAYISVSPQCPDCVFIASNNGVWKSQNQGTNFILLNNPSQSCRGFAVSDLDTLSMVYGYVDLEASANGGSSFSQVTWWANSNPDQTYVHADLRTAESVNGVFYVGTDGYLARSNNGGFSWERLNDGTGIRENYALGASQSNKYVHMVGSQDNGTSVLNQSGWIEWNGGDGMEAIIQPLNEDWMIGSWQYGSRNRTTNGAQTRSFLQGTGDGDWQAPLLLDPNFQMRVYHFNDTMWVSEEFGDQFTFVNYPVMGNLKVAAIAENNSNIIAIARNSVIRISTDAGQNFVNIRNNLPNYSITDIAFDPKRDSTILVTYNRFVDDGQKVFISHDLGDTWSNITYNLSDMPLRTAVIDYSDSAYIYVGGEIGVYYKSMAGTQWNIYNPNLPNVTVKDLEIQYGSNGLKAATWGRGLWEYKLVGRNNYPSILTTSIPDKPTQDQPKENVPQKVTSVISYNGALSSVYVKWSVGKPTLDNTIQMTNLQDSTWQSTTALPRYAMDSIMYFKVYAVGNNNDTTETYKFMYTVRFNATASIDETSFHDKVTISPNPSKGNFTINLDRMYSDLKMELRDVNGKLIQSSDVNVSSQFEINIKEAPGIYILNLFGEDKNASFKLIKE
jgi:hypothetical protein